MIVKLLGIIDLLGAILLILLRFNIGESIALIIAVLLLIKSLIFLSWISVLDILSGVVLILAALGYYYFFSWIFALWLLQKAFFSIFA